MNLLQRFSLFIKKENLFQPNDTLLLAVSGGIDSVVLCELCSQLKLSFMIAHCNFQLRGEESSRDENFVKELANKYQVRFLMQRFNTQDYALLEKISVQVAARELRYHWFYEILDEAVKPGEIQTEDHLKSLSPKYLVTAHHADDNIETMLMNF